MNMEERQQYIGASEAAAVLGLSRWSSPLDVWARKTGKIKQDDISDELPVWLGNELEEVVAKLFEKQSGKKVTAVFDEKGMPRMDTHALYPFIRCHVDREVVGEDAILQCKTASPRKYKEWEGEEIPAEYIIQEQHEMAVTGRKKAYIAVLMGNERFIWKEILRDDDVIREIIAKEVYFWNTFVVTGVMPDRILQQDRDVLSKLYPSSLTGSSIALPTEGDVIAGGIKTLESDIERLEEIIEQQKNELKVLIGDAETAESDVFKITWKNQTQNRIDSNWLLMNHPEIHSKALKQIKFRKLLITRKKKEA